MIPSRVLLLLEAGDGGAELLHGFFEQRAWGADIESHVAVAGNAVNLAVVEREVSFLGKETHQLGMVQAQSAAVEPHQERCLWLDGVGWVKKLRIIPSAGMPPGMNVISSRLISKPLRRRCQSMIACQYSS